MAVQFNTPVNPSPSREVNKPAILLVPVSCGVKYDKLRKQRLPVIAAWMESVVKRIEMWWNESKQAVATESNGDMVRR